MDTFDDILILTVATKYNKYVKEWEKSVKKFGYNYEILGIGEKWEGFDTKMNLILNKCKELKKNKIIVVVDSYDLLFLNGPEELYKKYLKIIPGKDKLLLGSDSYCVINCDPIIKTCKNKNSFVNGGFVMGPVNIIEEGYKYCLENGEEDDQVGWSRYISKNCNNSILDENSDVVFNYYSKNFMNPHLLFIDLPEITIKDDKIYNKTHDNYPIVVHIPYQSSDFGTRSEFIRNFVFPERENFEFIDYFSECGNHIYKVIKYPIYKEYVIKIVLCILLFLIFFSIFFSKIFS